MKLGTFLLAAPVVLQLVAADPQSNHRQVRRALERWNFPRQSIDIGSTSAGGASQTTTEKERETTSSTPTPTSSSTPTSTPTPTSTTPTSKPDEQTTSSSSSQVSSNQPTSPAATSTPQTSNAPPPSAPATSAPVVMTTPPPTSSALVTTNDQGHVVTTVLVITRAPTAAATTSAAADNTPKSISKGTIVGLAVTGSIAALIIILLIVWKLTNKRFSDLEDSDDNAIKWPELNKDSAAMTPIPARPTGRSGVETSALDDFDSRSATHSTANLTDAHYQPYSDDPGYSARPQYYDPYGGAPGTARPYASPPGSHDGDHKNWGVPAEGAQYYDAPARGPSPGPNMAYGDGLARGTSPGPNMAYGDSLGRGASPGPNMAYADPMGRTASPAPVGYGGYYDQPQVSGRLSPGPNLAYGGSQDHGMADPYGRRSPAPGVGGYGPRAASPGPNVAYDQGGYR